MEGTIIVQGIQAENLISEITKRIKKEFNERKDFPELVSKLIPELTTEQTANLLGVSKPFLSTIIQRFPEKLKPIYYGNVKRMYSTKEVLKLKFEGGYK